MKINWQFVKKPSVIIGGVVLFFVLLFLLNKGSGSSASSGQVVSTGPNPAEIAANTQLALAQISAGLQGQAIQVDYAKAQDANDTQLALATIAATIQGQTLAVQRDIAAQTVAAQVHGLDLNYQQSLANNDFALKYAQQTYDYGLDTTAMNIHLQEHLADNQLEGFKIQTDAAKFSQALAVIPTLKKGDRDNALISLTLNQPSSHGSVGVLPHESGGGIDGGFILSPIGSLL